MSNPGEVCHPDIVAIGASAGGFRAIESLLLRLPVSLPAAILIVLHRSAKYRSVLPDILRRCWAGPVVIGEEGQELKHGTCYLGLPAAHLTVMAGGRVHLLPDGLHRRHNVDALYLSLAQYAGPRTIGVVLTGMLNDGTAGLRALKAAGGVALVQDPEEAAFPDMPRSAIADDGPIDFIGTIAEIAVEIRRRVNGNAGGE